MNLAKLTRLQEASASFDYRTVFECMNEAFSDVFRIESVNVYVSRYLFFKNFGSNLCSTEGYYG